MEITLVVLSGYGNVPLSHVHIENRDEGDNRDQDDEPYGGQIVHESGEVVLKLGIGLS